MENDDADTDSTFSLEARFMPSNTSLVDSEQSSLAELLSQCCSRETACSAWKAENNNNASVNNTAAGLGGQLSGASHKTDFCSFPGQVCSPTGGPLCSKDSHCLSKG